MADCCCSFVAFLCTWLTAILYISAFGVDWWVLSGHNRANLFSYTMTTKSTTGAAVAFSEVTYEWSFICSDPFCDRCPAAVQLSPNCDSRPAGVKCPSFTPQNWCQAMQFGACVDMFTDACNNSVVAFRDPDELSEIREGKESCTKVTEMGGACRFAESCAATVGVAMGFGIVTAVLSVVVWVLSCRHKRSKHARLWAIATAVVLFLELCFGVTGFSLGYKWTNELPQTSIRPGLWCSMFAFIVNVFALLFCLLVAALNNTANARTSSSSSS